MANPNSLFLLADHIKLALLERQRSQALDLLQDEPTPAPAESSANAQDGHISRSLEQLRDGIEALQRAQARFEEAGDEGKALNISDALPGLQKTLTTLTAQFEGAVGAPPVAGASTATSSTRTATVKKAVRFQDKPLPVPRVADDESERLRAGLFNRPYTDNPEADAGAAAANDEDAPDNITIHQTHTRILADQDAQLDALGASISRQRELSMQIGDELDGHVALLEEGERIADRHQTRLDRARRQVGNLARSASDCKQMVAIVVLIVILLLLIIVLK